MYYQYSPDRLSTCPLTLHALLHIADGIHASGPVWTSWAFPIERFCGILPPVINSRRFPYASMDCHLTEVAQLSQIQLIHNLQDTLSFVKLRAPVQGQFTDFMACTFQPC